MERIDIPNSPMTTIQYVISATDLKQFTEDVVSCVIERTRKKDSETYLSRKAVSEMLDVTMATLWRWAREKYLLPVHVGRKVRYRKSDVMRILKEKGGCHE
ncbi:MAG: helix-turn-helix domain-containing protein [Bacteroidales bacterium]|nr:helix-turn-helix domain-containing protein [Bacteroidales bacterium]